jgi:hypothetical protein
MKKLARYAWRLAVICVAFGLGIWYQSCADRDSCYDSGGAWNQEWGLCERVIESAPARP